MHSGAGPRCGACWFGSALLVAAMAALSVWAWLATPDGPEVVLHRDVTGEPTRTGGITVLLVGLPLVALALVPVLAGVVRSGGGDMSEPAAREPADPMVHAWFGIGAGALLAVLHAMILLDAVGVIGDPVRPLLLAMGAFAALFGALLLRQSSGEALMRVSVNMPRPPGTRGRRALRRAAGGGFLATGVVTIVGALAAPVWLPGVALVVGLVATSLAGLVTSLRHQT